MFRFRQPLHLFIFVAMAASLVFLGYFFLPWPTQSTSVEYGVSWSQPYAESLGIDSQTGLKAVLEDLQVKKIRLPAYWTEVQPTANGFDWQTLDAQMDLIASHGAKALVVVGAKQPRWPEYWIPDWAQALSVQEREQAQLAYVEAVVRRYAHHPAVEAWQVENEPFLMFGEGQIAARDFVVREMELVKRLEAERSRWVNRPIYTTDSGELSLWLHFAGITDGLGVSVYRVVRSPFLGTLSYWFLPSWFYARKAVLLRHWIGPVFVSEFQMEPWADKPLTTVPLETQFSILSLEQVDANLQYARSLQLSPVYFWGAEWWYWLKMKQNKPEYWQKMQDFLAGS